MDTNDRDFTYYNAPVYEFTPFAYGATAPLAAEDMQNPLQGDPWAAWNGWLCPAQLQDITASLPWQESEVAIE